uniref:Ig-like domain-containing protein n=1 Tax=Roseihalotalea indica TaxID=2867963 RepID=A0AA49JC67_9BACT|nr:Ig-like domain-containing protein [Tunicatimonas sp. TK19036]
MQTVKPFAFLGIFLVFFSHSNGQIGPTIASEEVFKFETQSLIDARFIDGSLAWADYDNDGDQDVVITGSDGIYLFQNTDNSLVMVPNVPFSRVRRGSLSWADYDNDGDQDLLITGEEGTLDPITKLYQYNKQENTFTEVFEGVFEPVSESDAAWADYDNDGDLDVLIAGERRYKDGATLLYENMNGTSFIKVQSMSFEGVTDASVAWADYDNDGDLDVAITGIFEGYEFDYETGRTEDFYEGRTTLYKNNGDKTFTKANSSSFVGVRNGALAWIDHNNDGYSDLMIVGDEMPVKQAKLYQYNNGNDTFSEVFEGTFRGAYESDIVVADYDQDGYQDILVVGSDTKGLSATLYKNLSGQGFEEVLDTPFEGVYRGAAAWGDVNDDSYPDLAIVGTSNSSKLYITKPTQQRFLFPLDKEEQVAINTSLHFTLNEEVIKGSGNMYVNQADDDTVFETIDIASEKVTIDENTVSFYLDEDLLGEKTYYITVDTGALVDLEGNEFEGINSQDIWSFTTRPYSIPSLKVASTSVSPTNTKSFPGTFTFTERVSGFDISDILLENGVVYELQTTDSIEFDARIIADTEGVVSIQVLPGAARSLKQVDSKAASFEIDYDPNEEKQAFDRYDKVFPYDPEAGDYFGISASISDSVALIGSSRDDDYGDQSGSAYIFKKNELGKWTQYQKLTSSDGADLHRFGNAVSISANYAIIASPLDGKGSVYIFEKDSEGIWQQVQKITTPLTSDPDASHFGNSVLISGDYAFANSHSSNGKTVYIFKRDNEGDWQYWQTLTSPTESYSSTFGEAFDVYNNYLVIGAWVDRKAYIFEKNEVGLWEYNQLLTPVSSAPSDFGHHVSIINNTAFVASHGDEATGRRIYVFELSESGWGQKQILTQSDEPYRDYFASYISFSDDYGVVVNKRNEAMYIYGKNGEGDWERKQSISIPVIYPHIGSVGVTNQDFVLGTLFDKDKGSGAGSAYFFEVEKPAVDLNISATEVFSDGQSVFQTHFSFSEKVSDFAPSDITIINGSFSELTTADSITFIASITPTNPGQVKLHVDKDAVRATQDNSQGNKASYALFVYDPEAPTVAFEDRAFDTASATYTLDIVFSKAVSAFSKEDIIIVNGSVAQIQTSDSTSFYATIVPGNEGEISLSIPASAAYDNLGRENHASDQYAFIHDLISPMVVLTHHYGELTNQVDIEVTIAFSEAVSGFNAVDMQLDNATVKGLYTTDSITFQADIRPVVDGMISISVPVDVAHDRANNGNVSSHQVTMNVDRQQPDVAITCLSQHFTNEFISATIDFSEAVQEFDAKDISVENGTVTELTTTDSVTFHTIIAPMVEGTVTIQVEEHVTKDLAGNLNVASAPVTVVYDTTGPLVEIISSVDSITNVTKIPVIIAFNTPVVNFSKQSVIVRNAYLDTLVTQDSITFHADLIPMAEGRVDLEIAANTVSDQAGNQNPRASQLSTRVDRTAPTVEMTTSKALFSKSDKIVLTVACSEPVKEFVTSSLTVTNGLIDSLTTIDSVTFTALVIPQTDGVITVKIEESEVQDHAGNENQTRGELVLHYDSSSPSVSISSIEADTIYEDFLSVIIVFDEVVTGFSKAGIQTTNADIAMVTTTDSLAFTAQVILDAAGTFSLFVPANVVSDLSGNGNMASESFTRMYATTEDTTEVSRYSVGITALSEDTTNVPAFIASLYKVADNQFTVVDTKSVSGATAFTFNELEAGDYTVGIQPSDTNYLPVYLGDQFLLSDAQVLNLATDTTQNMMLFRKTSVEQSGTSTISGTLRQSEETSGGRLLMGDTDTGKVVANVAVYLLHPDTREIISYAVTDQQGNFIFTGLPVGRYLFTADYQGLSTDIQANVIQVSTDFETIKITAIAGRNIRVTSSQSAQQVTAIEDTLLSTNVRFYPNPVVHELRIDLPADWLEGQIMISDMSGKTVLVKQIEAVTTTVDVSRWHSGIYLIDVVKNGYRQSYKIEKY